MSAEIKALERTFDPDGSIARLKEEVRQFLYYLGEELAICPLGSHCCFDPGRKEWLADFRGKLEIINRAVFSQKVLIGAVCSLPKGFWKTKQGNIASSYALRICLLLKAAAGTVFIKEQPAQIQELVDQCLAACENKEAAEPAA